MAAKKKMKRPVGRPSIEPSADIHLTESQVKELLKGKATGDLKTKLEDAFKLEVYVSTTNYEVSVGLDEGSWSKEQQDKLKDALVKAVKKEFPDWKVNDQ